MRLRSLRRSVQRRMLKININDKGYSIPESFDELSFEQYCKAFYKLPLIGEDMDEVEQFRLIKENESRILSRIMGEEDDFCMDLPLTVYARLNEAISFIYDTDYFYKNAKAGITVRGKRYSIPALEKMSMRQFIDADMVMRGDENPLQYIELLAVLLLTYDNKGEYIPYGGDYEAMYGELRGMPCSKCLPLVFHFFKKGLAYRKLSEVYMKAEVVSPQPHSIQGS